MMPFLMDDDPTLFSAASTLKMKLFKVEDQLLAIAEDGEKTLFAKEGEDDVIFTLVSREVFEDAGIYGISRAQKANAAY